MNYELAKKLKEKGFPQEKINTYREGDGLSYVDSGLISQKDYNSISAKEFEDKRNRCYIPTLSELITSCGEKFSKLSLIGTAWFSEGFEDYDKGLKEVGAGSTPEEAVANLWLELNKK